MKYTVTEARNSMRKLLNQADAGEEVVIERYGEQYTFLARNGSSRVTKHFDKANPMITGGVAKSMTSLSKSEIRPETPAEASRHMSIGPSLDGSVKVSGGLCKHGQPKGECLVKGCAFNTKF